ncbi:MAG: CPBP family intramembrane glutamic endopeptidase [Candidatus Paceibacterota bacterium]
MKALLKSKYHAIIVSFYLLFCIYFFFFTELPRTLFAFNAKDLIVLFLLLAVSLIVFFVANYLLKFGTVGFNKRNLSRLPIIILYASLLIAVPEEILFRGIIQTHLSLFFQSTISIIVISSLIFGVAHILNGAKGLSLRNWNWKLVAMTFLAGIFLGLSFYITTSLVVPVILHILFILMMKVFIKDTM